MVSNYFFFNIFTKIYILYIKMHCNFMYYLDIRIKKYGKMVLIFFICSNIFDGFRICSSYIMQNSYEFLNRTEVIFIYKHYNSDILYHNLFIRNYRTKIRKSKYIKLQKINYTRK